MQLTFIFPTQNNCNLNPEMQQEISLEKFMKNLGVKCRGHTTPVASIWTSYNIQSGFSSCCNEQIEQDDEEGGRTSGVSEEHITYNAPSVSARKLGAALWELHHYHNPSPDYQPCKDKSGHPSPNSIHRSHEIVAPSSNRVNSSEEQINALNRIRSLEEQHVTDVSLIRALQKELTQVRRQVIDLLRRQQVQQLETDELRKKIAENKVRKNKERDRINAAIQLEEERKLRKRSETLCRELAKGIYEMKKSISSICTEVEKDRKLLNKLSSDIEAFLGTKNKISQEPINSHTLSDLPMYHEGPNQAEGADKITTAEGISIETSILQKPDQCEDANGNIFEGKYEYEGCHEFNDLIKNHFSWIDRRRMPSDKHYRIASSSHRSYSSPVRRWIEKLPYQNPENEVSLKLFPRLKKTKRIMHQRREWSFHRSLSSRRQRKHLFPAGPLL